MRLSKTLSRDLNFQRLLSGERYRRLGIRAGRQGDDGRSQLKAGFFCLDRIGAFSDAVKDKVAVGIALRTTDSICSNGLETQGRAGDGTSQTVLNEPPDFFGCDRGCLYSDHHAEQQGRRKCASRQNFKR